MSDLFPVRPAAKTKVKWKIVARYGYADANGVLVYEVVRSESHAADGRLVKRFIQRHLDPDGGWINNMTGVDRLLYMLPPLMDADRSRWVFVVEGEKCADRLAALGLTATTNPGGAGKWKDCYSAYLADRRVAILPDNDEAGLRHAQQVAESLAALAADVRVVALPGLPPKGDAVDWLDAGGDAATLIELTERAAHHPSAATSTVRAKEDYEANEDVEDTEDYQTGCNVIPEMRERYSRELDQGLTTTLTVGELVGVARQFQQEIAATGRAGLASDLWHFTRVLKGHPALTFLPFHEALERVEQVLSSWPQKENIGAWEHWFGREAEDAQLEFCANWGRINFVPGSAPLTRAVTEARSSTIELPTRSTIASYRLFLNVVLRLQWAKGAAPVMLCVVPLGSAIGRDSTQVCRYISLAVQEGLLVPVERAITNVKCARYRLDLSKFPNDHVDRAAAA